MKTLAIVALLVVTAGAYASVRTAAFVYEDLNFVSENPAVTGEQLIQVGRARWMANVVNRVQWLIDPSPRAFHLVNVAIHLVNGLLVYALAMTLTSSALTAWLTSAVFLLHPIQTEAVAYVAGRTELLAAALAMGAWLLAAHARRWWAHGLVWILVGLAVSVKESAVVIVPLMVLSDLVHGRRLSWWRLALLLLPIGGIAWSVLAYDHLAVSPLGRWGYAATQATALWRYVGLILVPWGFTVDHDFELVPWLVRWVALWALVGVGSLLCLLIATSGDEDHSRAPLWASWRSPAMESAVFGLLWALIALGPRFVMRLPEHLNEHQLFLPMVGISLAIGAVLSGWVSPRVVH